ncbi:MAG: ATP-dependent zinc metalloprotease FtsH [Planctomycetales bacterium]|nr:ATP-dependent zinc metalloprotease FtsH [Planctomycetales bacterium]
MSNNDERRSNDGKTPPPASGQSLLWFILLGVGSIAVITLILSNVRKYELPYPDFVALVEASARESQGGPYAIGPDGERLTGTLEVVKEVHGSETRRRIRYSDLKFVRVGQRISGEVEREDLDATNVSDREKRKVGFVTYRPNSDNVEEQIVNLLNGSHIDWKHENNSNSFSTYFLPMLLFTGLVLMFIITMRRLGGAGSPMQFGRSRGRLYALEDLGVTFDDVAGIDEAVEEVREVVDFLRAPEKYQKLGGRIPKGVLLVGPPGTGKTLLAKAIAGEAGVPFFSLSGSDFVEMFVGVGAARVRDMFQQAEQKAPCIIFIDELDALGKSRGGSIMGGHDEREQTLNALLVEMDGFDSNNGVIVMAATNRPETLDQALLRPGRFDRHVLVDRPDVRGREAILKVHVKNVKLDPTVDLKHVASISPGFVGADLANLVNEAALLAARAELTTVGMKQFNEGVERVIGGLEKKQRVMNDDEKQRVAYHEAGHALVAYSLPNTDPVHKVSIIPRGLAALGYTMQRPEGDRYLMTKSELESRIHVLLAGTIAEEIIYSDISSGAQNDLERATEIARSMVMDYGMSRMGRINYRAKTGSAFLATPNEERTLPVSPETAREIDMEVKGIIDRSVETVRHILEVRRPSLQALTDRLIEVESVDEEELRRIVDETAPGPLVVPGTGTDATTRSANSNSATSASSNAANNDDGDSRAEAAE